MTDSVDLAPPTASATVTPPRVPIVAWSAAVARQVAATPPASASASACWLSWPPEAAPAQVAAGTWLGDYRSLADLRDFAAGCDVITFDHEHVPDARPGHAGARWRPGPAAAAALRLPQDGSRCESA